MMSKKPFFLTLLTILIGGQSLFAFTFTDKTFLLPRSRGANMAIENGIWHRHITHDVGNSFGMTLQASPFYQESDNEGGLGNYFGSRGSTDSGKFNTIVIKSGNSIVAPLADFPAESIVHDSSRGNSTLDATLRLRPDQEAAGVFLAAFQDLSGLLEGLSIKLVVPVVYVRHDIDMQIEGEVTSEDGFSIEQYFNGTLVQDESTSRLQEALSALRINGSETEFGIADVLLTLAYNFLEGEDHYIALTGGATIPTDNDSSSMVLFEPTLGSGNHAGLHVGADGGITIWKKEDDYAIEGLWRFLYTYLFESTQHRVPGLLSQDGSPIPWGHYRLGGELDKNGVFPLANVLRQEMHIAIGSQIEAFAAFVARAKPATLTLGATLFARNAERLRLKNFPENIYGLASSSYDTSNEFSEQSGLESGETFITKEMQCSRLFGFLSWQNNTIHW